MEEVSAFSLMCALSLPFRLVRLDELDVSLKEMLKAKEMVVK